MIKLNIPCNREAIFRHSEQLRDGLTALANQRAKQKVSYDPETGTYTLSLTIHYMPSDGDYISDCLGKLLNGVDIKHELKPAADYFQQPTVECIISDSKTNILNGTSRIPDLLTAINETVFLSAITEKFAFPIDRKVVISEQNPLLIGCLEYVEDKADLAQISADPEIRQRLQPPFRLRCNIIQPLVESLYCMDDIRYRDRQEGYLITNILKGMGIGSRLTYFDMVSEEPMSLVIDDGDSAKQLLRTYQSHVSLSLGRIV